VALVLGYEGLDLRRRFAPFFDSRLDDDSTPTTWERIRFLFLTVVPWIGLYELTIRLPSKPIRFAFLFEDRLPVLGWTAIIYESIYVAVVLAPWCARTRKDLRQLITSAWVSMIVVFPFYWLVPSGAPRRPLVGGGWGIGVLGLERNMDPPLAAFPSFHVLWAVFVARLYRPRWIRCWYVGAIAVSCITTGMHYIPDVLVAIALAPLFVRPQTAWEALRRLTERLANSWREWRFGRVRIINHAFYAGAAAFLQVLVVKAAAGTGQGWKVFASAMLGLVGAAAWAFWIEGSSRLRRPFGFYGGLIGVSLGCLLFPERWILLGANCLGAPWLQAIGRLRCLVNGCCHGRPSSPASGISVTHPRSRVTRLAELTGVPIYPTQLYSILSNLVLGLILARLWTSHCNLSVICGVYCLGSGFSRFVEEAYRGEPQTPLVFGLRLYQWLAAAMVTLGAVLTCLSSPQPPRVQLSADGFLWAAAFGCVAAFAMGVDFPESNEPLTRLT